MKRLWLLGEVDEGILARVRDELITMSRFRVAVIAAVALATSILRPLFFLAAPQLRPSEMTELVTLGDAAGLALMSGVLVGLRLIRGLRVLEYVAVYGYITVWVASIALRLLSLDPVEFGSTEVLTVFVNILLINMFFFIHPLVALPVDALLFTALGIAAHRAGQLDIDLVFSIVPTMVFLALIDVTLYRTSFRHVYFRIEREGRIKTIEKQNDELQERNEEIRAQQASIEHYARRIETIIANVPGMVYRSRADDAWSMLFVSDRATAITGYSAGDFLSGRVLFGDLIHSADRRRVSDTIHAHIENRREFEMEYRIETKDGKTKWVREFGRGVFDDDGSLLWIGGIILDVDDAKRQDRVREDVERTVRHDLKNPLNAVIGGSDLLLSSDNLDDEARELLSLIRHSGYKMLHMIDNSLDLLKMEEGYYQLKPSDCNLVEVVQKALSEVSEAARRKGLKVVASVDGEPFEGGKEVAVSGEPYKLEGMFANLLANAVEASPPERPISVEIADGDVVVVRLHNDGAVPAAIRSSFFERYVTSGKKHGTGLGTYSARLIARAHGGDVSFTTSVEDGTTLIVELPKSAGEAP